MSKDPPFEKQKAKAKAQQAQLGKEKAKYREPDQPVPAPHIPPAQKRRTKRQAPGNPSYPGARASTEGAGNARKEAAKRALAAVRRP